VYYPDLSPYKYNEQIQGGTRAAPPFIELNIGWLERGFPFPIGSLTFDFLDTLFTLCTKPVHGTRGYHICDLCDELPGSALDVSRNGERISIHIPFPIKAERHGHILTMGSDEIRVQGKEHILYAAPTLIYHYCSVHSYLPPQEFMDAVLETARGG
jgi:hypothetical protein